MNKLASQEEER